MVRAVDCAPAPAPARRWFHRAKPRTRYDATEPLRSAAFAMPPVEIGDAQAVASAKLPPQDERTPVAEARNFILWNDRKGIKGSAIPRRRPLICLASIYTGRWRLPCLAILGRPREKSLTSGFRHHHSLPRFATIIVAETTRSGPAPAFATPGSHCRVSNASVREWRSSAAANPRATGPMRSSDRLVRSASLEGATPLTRHPRSPGTTGRFPRSRPPMRPSASSPSH